MHKAVECFPNIIWSQGEGRESRTMSCLLCLHGPQTKEKALSLTDEDCFSDVTSGLKKYIVHVIQNIQKHFDNSVGNSKNCTCGLGM
jgi:hypothetical protein